MEMRTPKQIAEAIAAGDERARAELEKMMGKPVEEMTAEEKKLGLAALSAFDGKWQEKRPKITLTYVGRDSWDRPVYEAESGKLYVDVDPRSTSKPCICTKYGNRFDGEPDMPIPADMEVEFIPKRDTW